MAKMNDATPWLLPITISASGTRANTFQTSGTWVDRDIQVSITTPAGSYDAYGGQLSITSTNLGITPTVTLSDANNKNISNYTVGARDTTYGYYVQINGSSSTGSKVITATRAAVTKSAAAGWVNQNSGTQAIASANATATVSVNKGSSSTYVNIKAATLANAGTRGTTYTDISSTGPILISNDYLYINAGYISATKISLARLVPDLEGLAQGGAAQMRAGYSLYDKDGKVITGTMQDSTCTVAGGALSITANSSIGPGALSLTNGNDSNMSNIIIGAQNTSTYPYYFKVHGATEGNSTIITAERTAITAAHTEGYQAQQAATTKIASANAFSTVSITVGSNDTYISLKGATVTYTRDDATTTNYSGTPTVSVTLSAQTTTGVAITDTKPSSGYYLTIGGSSSTLSGSTNVKIGAVYDTREAGYLPKRSKTQIYSSANYGATISIGAGTKTRYITIPTANYSVSCSKTNPSVAYTKSTTMKSATSGSYYFDYGGSVTDGTHKATATISAAGYVPTGSKSTTDEAIGVTTSGAGRVYIQTASVSATGSVTTQPSVVAATTPINLVTAMFSTAYNLGLATTSNTAGTVAVKHNASEGYTGTLTNVADSNVSVETIVTLGGSQYISGVVIQSGDTGNFTVNDGTYTWTWKKDANGNVWVV